MLWDESDCPSVNQCLNWIKVVLLHQQKETKYLCHFHFKRTMYYLWELGYGSCFFIVKQPLLPKLYEIYVTQAKKKKNTCCHPLSLSQKKQVTKWKKVTSLKIMDISGFEHCWKRLGKYKYIINQNYIPRRILLQNSYHEIQSERFTLTMQFLGFRTCCKKLGMIYGCVWPCLNL